MRTKGFTFWIMLLARSIVAEAQASDKRINSIRTEVDAITQNLSTYRKTAKRLEGISKDAKGVYFTSESGLKKIDAKIYGNTGRSDNEYYYRGDRLIFGINRWTKYDRSIIAGPVKPIQVVETIAYFDAGECFALFVDGKAVQTDTKEWTEKLYEVVATSSIFQRRL